jgi:hypothetical protein
MRRMSTLVHTLLFTRNITQHDRYAVGRQMYMYMYSSQKHWINGSDTMHVGI